MEELHQGSWGGHKHKYRQIDFYRKNYMFAEVEELNMIQIDHVT